MCDRSASPPSSSSSSSSSVAAASRCRSRHFTEEDGDAAACTGRSCQSCTAGVIADCVAVCCCPCAVVNLLTLAFVKLPWAVARRCLGRRRERRRRLAEERRKRGGDGEGAAEIVVNIGEELLNDEFGAELKLGEDVWLELYELGHLGGFGRVSFTGIPFQDKGD
ncbi:uncharacterized protein LOC131008752 [Salvia miltiorrhiza]|uniref:uncharacterized protein LOC131008752 n=1 Tax=Salvia miltiorrhiza TaxID=226208 RepID=UPI0025AD0221|nr:uncharacterized protein LOC131008752 [Salvia miltiorrhiza]